MRTRSATARRGLAFLLVALLAACVEPPVRESITLVFDAHGGLEARVETRIEPESLYERAPRARERIREAREPARCGEDPFTLQLERLSPASLRRSLGYRGGDLREVLVTARFDEPRAVERLFEPHPLSVSLARAGSRLQLEILPGTAGRATPAERREAAGALGRFSEAGARYLEALSVLWRYLDGMPERERPVVAQLLGVGGEFEPASEHEVELVLAVDEAMSDVQKFFQLEEGRGESLNELSRRVWDPFPASVAVEVTGRAEEVTGFLDEGAGRFAVPAVSLQGALEDLAGRWVSPDPLSSLAAAVRRGDDRPPSLDAFLARGRRSRATPTPPELREAIERALAPRPVYRLRWVLSRG